MRKIILFSLLFSLTIAPQQKVEAKLPGWLTHPATMVVEAALIAAGITLSVVCKKKIIDQYKEKIDFLNDLSEHLQIDGPNSLTIENLESSQAIAFAKQKNQSEFLKEIIENHDFIENLTKKYKLGKIGFWGGIGLSGFSGATLLISTIGYLKNKREEREEEKRKKVEKEKQNKKKKKNRKNKGGKNGENNGKNGGSGGKKEKSGENEEKKKQKKIAEEKREKNKLALKKKYKIKNEIETELEGLAKDLKEKRHEVYYVTEVPMRGIDESDEEYEEQKKALREKEKKEKAGKVKEIENIETEIETLEKQLKTVETEIFSLKKEINPETFDYKSEGAKEEFEKNRQEQKINILEFAKKYAPTELQKLKDKHLNASEKSQGGTSLLIKNVETKNIFESMVMSRKEVNKEFIKNKIEAINFLKEKDDIKHIPKEMAALIEKFKDDYQDKMCDEELKKLDELLSDKLNACEDSYSLGVKKEMFNTFLVKISEFNNVKYQFLNEGKRKELQDKFDKNIYKNGNIPKSGNIFYTEKEAIEDCIEKIDSMIKAMKKELVAQDQKQNQ